MRDDLVTYFDGERSAGLCLAALGVVGFAAALFFYQPRWELRSFAVTLGVIALLEIVGGAGLYLKTGPQVAGLVGQLGADQAAFHAAETARMIKVQRNFVTLELTWITLILASALTAVLAKHRFHVSGIALALLVNFGVILAFDLVAERRGALYLAALERSAARG